MYEIIHASAVGRQNWGKGKGNEDTKIVDRAHGIYVLADGMGGHNAAKTASHLAATYVHRELCDVVRLMTKGKLDGWLVTPIISDLFKMCNAIILGGGREHSSLKGMGTTLDACVVHNNIVYAGHAGNGRVYYLPCGSALRKVTREHVIYPEGSETMPEEKRTLIESRLGLENYVGKEGFYADMYNFSLAQGDVLFMATDGLTHTVSEREMAACLSERETARKNLLNLSEYPQDIARAFCTQQGSSEDPQAFSNAQRKLGGRDNTSFIAVRRVG